MKNLEEALKLIEIQNKVNKISSASQAIIQKFNQPESIFYKSSLLNPTFIDMYTEGNASNVYGKLNAIDRMLAAGRIPSIPQSITGVVNNIFYQQSQIQEKLMTASTHFAYTAQTQSVFYSQSKLFDRSSFATFYAVRDQNEAELSAIKQINEETAEVLASVLTKQIVTKGDLKELWDKVDTRFNTVETLVVSRPESKKRIRNYQSWKKEIWNVVIALILWLTPSPTAPVSITPAQHEISNSELLKNFQLMLDENRFWKRINKNIYLRQLPDISSTKLFLLKKNLQVQIVNSNRSWACVIAVDANRFPIQGWIPKKYLSIDRNRTKK